MRSLSELTGQNLVWHVQPGSASIPEQGQRSFVLFRGDEPVVQAQVMWKRLDHFDVVMESGEGTYQVHIDLAGASRHSEVGKAGGPESLAAFELVSEGLITCTGWISTASRPKLAWSPTHQMGYEYVIFIPGGPRLITLAAAASVHIGGNPGQMTLAPEIAGDADLAPLVALGFALANEQVLLLHREMETGGGQTHTELMGQPVTLEDVLKVFRNPAKPE